MVLDGACTGADRASDGADRALDPTRVNKPTSMYLDSYTDELYFFSREFANTRIRVGNSICILQFSVM